MNEERMPLEAWMFVWMKLQRFKEWKKLHDKKYLKKRTNNLDK
jgi:hypothetical protein